MDLNAAQMEELALWLYLLGKGFIYIGLPALIGLGISEHRQKKAERRRIEHVRTAAHSGGGVPNFIISRRNRRCG